MSQLLHISLGGVTASAIVARETLLIFAVLIVPTTEIGQAAAQPLTAASSQRSGCFI
jgi:hypothetical protein